MLAATLWLTCLQFVLTFDLSKVSFAGIHSREHHHGPGHATRPRGGPAEELIRSECQWRSHRSPAAEPGIPFLKAPQSPRKIISRIRSLFCSWPFTLSFKVQGR